MYLVVFSLLFVFAITFMLLFAKKSLEYKALKKEAHKLIVASDTHVEVVKSHAAHMDSLRKKYAEADKKVAELEKKVEKLKKENAKIPVLVEEVSTLKSKLSRKGCGVKGSKKALK